MTGARLGLAEARLRADGKARAGRDMGRFWKGKARTDRSKGRVGKARRWVTRTRL